MDRLSSMSSNVDLNARITLSCKSEGRPFSEVGRIGKKGLRFVGIRRFRQLGSMQTS